MTVAQIGETVRSSRTRACSPSKQASTAVEIHLGHGYLLSQFISPKMNRRSDDYGGAS